MARILIEGGHPLSGEVLVGGAKNAALPIMAATILTSDTVHLSNIPRLNDVETMQKVLRALGGSSEWEDDGKLKIKCNGGIQEEAPYELVKTMRASFFVMGPLLSRLKRARVPLPGGCAIGTRPVNIHLKGFEALGAKVSIDGGFAVAVADRLIGTGIHLDFPSVGATENLMMAASLAEGSTTIENAAQEPEIIDLGNFLNSMGAKIQGTGGPTIQVEGVHSLHGGNYRVIPDRIDAGTFLVLGAVAHGPLTILNANPSHQIGVMAKLQEMGATIAVNEDRMTVECPGRLRGADVKTLPYPGFPTDMQAQFTVAMSVAQGTSLVTESVFENRFMHIAELVRMGANLNIRDRTVVVNGVEKLIGAPVSASDLRAGAAMVMAGLIAEGHTEVSNVFHIERGYENLVERLSGLGANIRRIEDSKGPTENNRR